jgi:hypothetical protein
LITLGECRTFDNSHAVEPDTSAVGSVMNLSMSPAERIAARYPAGSGRAVGSGGETVAIFNDEGVADYGGLVGNFLNRVFLSQQLPGWQAGPSRNTGAYARALFVTVLIAGCHQFPSAIRGECRSGLPTLFLDK